MSALPAAAPVVRPVLYRRARGRMVGGVAAGIGVHLRIPVIAVRLIFVLLTFGGGLGLVLYGAYWIVLPPEPGVVPRSHIPAWLEYTLAGIVAAVTLAIVAFTLPLGQLFVPAILACLGGALIWRQASEAQRDRWWRASRSSLSAAPRERYGRIRLIAGSVLVVLGAVAVLAREDFSTIRDGLLAMVVTVVGLALITGPWWIRMVSDLSDERRERIRSQERAELAAHLHDSVLQTLALIQRSASSPREVARLARGQERELRTLLYGRPAPVSQLSEALRTVAAEVEDDYAIVVDVVVVGDLVLDERTSALVAASREALVNAAKHAGVGTVSVYAEVEPTQVAVFVKDRGAGFVLDDVAEDRQGVRNSIVGRIERHGGEVFVRSSPGEGTEVELKMKPDRFWQNDTSSDENLPKAERQP